MDLSTTGTAPCRCMRRSTCEQERIVDAGHKVHGKTAARHASDAFVGFLHDVLRLCKPEREIHIILDNLSAHKTQRVEAFLDEHPHVQLHFTPTYSSWLSQVEIWFARIEREVIARGVFTSVRDLAR